MVREDRFEGGEAYRCGECGFHYERRDTAERCERFCREHDACNTEIIRDALEQQD